MEAGPHGRHPDLMPTWTEVGRAAPKVVPRRGSMVHGAKVQRVAEQAGAGGVSAIIIESKGRKGWPRT